MPPVELNDAVYLRTATSIEYTLIDVYGTIVESGALDSADQEMVERLIDDHRAAAETTSELTREAGGEPYDCANAWYMERTIDPIIDAIEGDEELDIPPSDEPARDWLVLVNGLESMASAMYQQFVETLTEPELRAEVMVLGAQDARHAAAVAIVATGAPEGYVNPELLGEDLGHRGGCAHADLGDPDAVRIAGADPDHGRRAERGRHPVLDEPRDARRQLVHLRRDDLLGVTAGRIVWRRTRTVHQRRAVEWWRR